MGCRNIAKSQPIRQRIIEKTGNSDILLLPLDLASFQSISHFCKQLAETGISIKALVNNAGVMCKDFGKTVDGFETSIGVNYIGTVFLTESLIPLMHPGSRIVMTTSLTRYIGKIDSSFSPTHPEPTNDSRHTENRNSPLPCTRHICPRKFEIKEYQ